MAWTWTYTLTKGNPIQLVEIDEIRDAIDHIYDNPGCVAHNTTVDSNDDNSVNSGYCSSDHSTHYNGDNSSENTNDDGAQFSSDNSSYDSGFDSGHDYSVDASDENAYCYINWYPTTCQANENSYLLAEYDVNRDSTESSYGPHCSVVT